jgi:hypothetical protein
MQAKVAIDSQGQSSALPLVSVPSNGLSHGINNRQCAEEVNLSRGILIGLWARSPMPKSS